MSNMASKIPHNPEVIGPGVWFSIHTAAYNANSMEKIIWFDLFVRNVIESFPCLECRAHAQKYLSEHPFDKYTGRVDTGGNDISRFLWAFHFHNFVNSRLGKYQYNLLEAWKLYDEREACEKNCTEIKKEEKKKGSFNFV